MIAPHIIERVRTVRIEDECARRNIHLRGIVDRCGPCPVCGGHDRFAINIRKQVFLCRVCDVAGDVIKLVQHIDACTFAQAIEILTGEEARPQARPPAAPKKRCIAEYESEQRRKARWLWAQCQPITGSIAERYLRARGITCPLPATLGFLPARGEHPPAMTAAFGLCDEPEPGLIMPPDSVGSVHLTLLAPDGSGKADVEKPKLVVGPISSLPIVLAPPNDLLGLAITEGIEDGLTAHLATGLGVWAAGSAVRLPKLADSIPSYVECLTVYAHADPAGQDGARGLAEALSHRDIQVIIEGLP